VLRNIHLYDTTRLIDARDEFVSHLRDYFRRDNHCYTLVGEVLAGEQSIAFQYRASPEGEEDSMAGWMGAEFITMEGGTN